MENNLEIELTGFDVSQIFSLYKCMVSSSVHRERAFFRKNL